MSTLGFLRRKLTVKTPFHRPQIPAVIALLQAKVAQFEPWVKGNATALQSKQQGGYSAKPQGENPKGCAP
jgi:hypothetical protein